MASKSNLCSNPNKKARIIAKIRGFTPTESQPSKPWISISKSNQSDRVLVSFIGDNSTSAKDVYEVDHCYEQNEGMDLIFSREIMPLIPNVFDGINATFVGFGARGSGKTYAIQGSHENPGLVTLAVTEILSRAEEAGKSVTISIYEAFQDHVYDFLDPSRTEVQVLENAKGKIALKGLSQVPITSIVDFQKLYYDGCSAAVKITQKKGIEQPPRNHKGVMINILAHDGTSNMKLVGKINFVDLAGYTDCRRKEKNVGESITFDNAESTKINKSLYAFLNVVHALNANENRVPYRESKLTRVLQDSLGGRNHVLILTCMNPLVCQDTAYAMRLASRACQGTNHVLTDATNRSKSSCKPTVASSMKRAKPASFSLTSKKQTNSRVRLSQKKSSSTVQGKKLFVDEIESITSEQNPHVCQDTAYAMGLASRACQGTNHVLTDATNRSKSSCKPTVASSMKRAKPASLSVTSKKQTNSRVRLSQKKSSFTVQGKKLFVDEIESITSEQEQSASMIPLALDTPEEETLSASVFERKELSTMPEEETLSAGVAFNISLIETLSASVLERIELTTMPEEETLSSSVLERKELTTMPEEYISLLSALETSSNSIPIKDLHIEENQAEDSLYISGIKALVPFEDDCIESDADNSVVAKARSPPLSATLKEITNDLKSLCSASPLCLTKPPEVCTPYSGPFVKYADCMEPKTPAVAVTKFESPREAFSARSSGMKQSLVQGYLQFLNSASKEDLKRLRGIGEKRATYILERREESPEPFKSLEDLRDIGMSGKQIKGMMKAVAGELFN